MSSIPDAEALYTKLLAGVKTLMRPETKLVGITSGGAWLVERLHDRVQQCPAEAKDAPAGRFIVT